MGSGVGGVGMSGSGVRGRMWRQRCSGATARWWTTLAIPGAGSSGSLEDQDAPDVATPGDVRVSPVDLHQQVVPGHRRVEVELALFVEAQQMGDVIGEVRGADDRAPGSFSQRVGQLIEMAISVSAKWMFVTTTRARSAVSCMICSVWRPSSTPMVQMTLSATSPHVTSRICGRAFSTDAAVWVAGTAVGHEAREDAVTRDEVHHPFADLLDEAGCLRLHRSSQVGAGNTPFPILHFTSLSRGVEYCRPGAYAFGAAPLHRGGAALSRRRRTDPVPTGAPCHGRDNG